jgi:tetratricopeptide (TPR) repeat protein
MSMMLNLVSSLTGLACRWQAQGRDADASRLLDRLSAFRLPAQPSSATAHVRLAFLALRQRHFRRARRHLVRAVKLRPADARARFLLAVALEHDRRARPELVLCQYRRALHLSADRPRWWAAYGRCLARLGRVDAGLRVIREAAALAPDDPRLGVALVAVLVRAGRYEEAEREARAVRFRYPRDPRGAALWAKVRYRMALRCQTAERQRGEREDRPTVLPFLRPVDAPPVARPGTDRILRRDRASRPAPHQPRLFRKRDPKQMP